MRQILVRELRLILRRVELHGERRALVVQRLDGGRDGVMAEIRRRGVQQDAGGGKLLCMSRDVAEEEEGEEGEEGEGHRRSYRKYISTVLTFLILPHEDGD